jgi:HD superfamily phosphohydrolase
MAHKLFRDIVHGYIELDDDDLKIVEHPLFQRLGRIRTGLHRTVYPCANQTRFEHSIGVAYLASLICDSITRRRKNLSDDMRLYLNEHKREVRFAALCHDLGHGPLSHLSECFFDKDKLKQEIYDCIGKDKSCDLPFAMRPNHELMSGLVVLKHPEINGILKNSLKLDVQLIFDMITGNYNIDNLHDKKNILIQIMHSTIDADRLDFVLRDNKMTAGDFFALDAERIITSYRLYSDYQIVLDRRALSCVSNLINARSAIYEWVVNHHKNVLISGIIAQYIDDLLLLEKSTDGDLLQLPVDVSCFSDLFTYKGLTESKFDDYDLLWILKNNKNNITNGKMYCEHIFDRKCFKSLWKSGAEFDKVINSDFFSDYLKPLLYKKTGYARLIPVENKLVNKIDGLDKSDIFIMKCKSRFYDLTDEGDKTVNPFEKIYLYDDNTGNPYKFTEHFHKRIYKWKEHYMYVYINPQKFKDYKQKIIHLLNTEAL